jgi:hypothetical protein
MLSAGLSWANAEPKKQDRVSANVIAKIHLQSLPFMIHLQKNCLDAELGISNVALTLDQAFSKWIIEVPDFTITPLLHHSIHRSLWSRSISAGIQS